MLLQNIEDKFIKVSKIITNNTNITFGFKGSSYYCTPTPNNGFHISFAVMPQNPSPDLIKALEGFLDHELGHALFSDFKVIENIPDIMKIHSITINSKSVSLIKNITNILEDSYVERKMVEKYRGSNDNLMFMNDFVNSKLVDNLGDSITGWKAILITLSIICSDTELPNSLAKYSTHLKNTCKKELAKIKFIDSTQDSCNLACLIYKKLNEQDESEDSKDEAQNGSEDSEDKSQGEPESSEDKSQNDSKDGSEYFSDELQDDFQSSLTDYNYVDYKKIIFEKYSEVKDENNYSAYLPRPYTREYDSIEYNKKIISNRINSSTYLNYYANKLSNLIKSDTLHAWEIGLSRGKLNTSNLYRLTTDNLIFKKKQKPKLDLDIVFSIGVDVSQSMLPLDTLHILTTVLEMLGHIEIPFEVFTYTSMPYPNPQVISVEDLYDLTFTRTMALKICIIKKYQDNYQSIKNYVSIEEQGWTPTPEAYEYAINSLATRTETNKIFINISDGYPQENEAIRNKIYYCSILKNLMLMCDRKKINYINIGYKIYQNFLALDPNALLTTEKNFLDKFIHLLNSKIRTNIC